MPLWLGLWLGSEESVRVFIFPPEPSKECVKVSHVIFECRVINHHPYRRTRAWPSAHSGRVRARAKVS